MKYFIVFISIVVLAAVITGFFFVGTPAAERERQFDERRVSDLQYITDALTSHWQIRKSLPENLEEVKDLTPPRDPVTQAAYEYKKTGDLKYTVCATFSGSNISEDSRAYPKPAYPYYGGTDWSHEAGYVCFDQEIYPQLLQPLPVQPAAP